ncbi:MAG: restriction endonuclease subunit S [Blastomonas sp.]
MSSDWRTVELSDIADLSMGETLLSKNLTGDGIPVFSANTDKGPWGYTSNNRRRLRRGDIVIGARGSIGFPRRPNFDAFTCTQTTIAVQPDRAVVDSEYLHHALCAADILGIASQQAVPMLTIGALSPLEIALPKLEDQRRIAEVLRSVDEAVAAQSALCSHLRQVADDLADELFAREIADCDGDLFAYGDACETVQVGIVVKPASYYVDDGGVPALRSTNIKRNAIDYSAPVQLSHDGHEINRKSALRAGDVVTIRTGEPGKTAVIADDAPSPLNCIDIIFSRPKPVLRPYFAAYFINSNTARLQIAAMQGGLAQQHFNVGEMKKLKMPLPSLTRQDRIIEVLDAAWQSVRIEEAQLATLKSTKTALMSALLSGQIRVPA